MRGEEFYLKMADHEQKIELDGIEIKYILNSHSNTFKKLVVIFSGLGKSTNFSYDFNKAFNNIPVATLHIKDEFFGNCAYYIMHNKSFSIESVIIKLINSIMKQFLFGYEDVALVGGSKGGSASLYYGLRYPFSIAIASAPQIKIGNFLNIRWKDIALNMTGSLDNTTYLNNIIINAIKNCNLYNMKYIFTSYIDEFEPLNYYDFINIPNISFFDLRMPEISRHNQITSTSLPLIKKIIYNWCKGLHTDFRPYNVFENLSQLSALNSSCEQ